MAEAFSWELEAIKKDREEAAHAEKVGAPVQVEAADDRALVAREAVSVARSWWAERRGLKVADLDFQMLVRRLNKLRKRG